MHRHVAAAALDDPDQLRDMGSWRHEVDDRDLAFLGLENGFKHQRARTIVTLDLAAASGGSNLPSAMFRCAQKGGEASPRIETGKAKPVD